MPDFLFRTTEGALYECYQLPNTSTIEFVGTGSGSSFAVPVTDISTRIGSLERWGRAGVGIPVTVRFDRIESEAVVDGVIRFL